MTQPPPNWPSPQGQPPFDTSGPHPTAPLPPAPQKKPFLKRPAVWAVAAALVVGVGIGNASGQDAKTSTETASTSPSSPTTEPTTAAPTSSTTPSSVVPPAAVVPTVQPTAVTSSPAPVVDFAMPNLVGIDLQTAQNTVQTYGVFLSRSHDLLGSRQQLIDSNWIVCTQNVPAGQRVTGDAEGLIDLGVVKREEACP